MTTMREQDAKRIAIIVSSIRKELEERPAVWDHLGWKAEPIKQGNHSYVSRVGDDQVQFRFPGLYISEPHEMLFAGSALAVDALWFLNRHSLLGTRWRLLNVEYRKIDDYEGVIWMTFEILVHPQ